MPKLYIPYEKQRFVASVITHTKYSVISGSVEETYDKDIKKAPNNYEDAHSLT